MEEDHDLPDDFLFRPRLFDVGPSAGSNPIDFFQALGVVLDDLEDFRAEFLNQFRA